MNLCKNHRANLVLVVMDHHLTNTWKYWPNNGLSQWYLRFYSHTHNFLETTIIKHSWRKNHFLIVSLLLSSSNQFFFIKVAFVAQVFNNLRSLKRDSWVIPQQTVFSSRIQHVTQLHGAFLPKTLFHTNTTLIPICMPLQQLKCFCSSKGKN